MTSTRRDSTIQAVKNLAGQNNLGFLQHWSPYSPLTGNIFRLVNHIAGFYMAHAYVCTRLHQSSGQLGHLWISLEFPPNFSKNKSFSIS